MSKKPPHRRRYPLGRIKMAQCYDTHEIAKLGFHRDTVQHWLKEGLTPIDERRPIPLSYVAV
jgi:hypothetical protein